MRRVLTKPKNPEALGRLFAALRVYSGQREPKNATERKVNDALKAQKVPQAVAKRMVSTLDSMPKGPRNKLLGEIADPKFAPPARAAAPTIPPPTTPVPTAAVGTLGRRIDVDRVDVEGMLGEGPRAQPVYTIQYNGLWCEDETTWDQGSWADEIYLITSAVHIADGENIVRTEHHPVDASYYEDVDSDEARIGPVAACWHGNSDPVSLTVVASEHDQGDPNAYKEEIDALVKAAIAALTPYWPPLGVLELFHTQIADGINWLLDTGDDPIGVSQTVVNPRSLLEWYAARYTSPYYSGGKETGLLLHFLTTHRGGGATYVNGFEVTRDPPLDKNATVVIV
jgi:hypothetical protein